MASLLFKTIAHDEFSLAGDVVLMAIRRLPSFWLSQCLSASLA
jgi:hypothetical protein